ERNDAVGFVVQMRDGPLHEQREAERERRREDGEDEPPAPVNQVEESDAPHRRPASASHLSPPQHPRTARPYGIDGRSCRGADTPLPGSLPPCDRDLGKVIVATLPRSSCSLVPSSGAGGGA